MKTVRLLALLLAGSIFAMGGSYAQGQAEISPDHFEPTVHVSTAAKPATSMHHSGHHNTHMTASRHARRQQRHHSPALG